MTNKELKMKIFLEATERVYQKMSLKEAIHMLRCAKKSLEEAEFFMGKDSEDYKVQLAEVNEWEKRVNEKRKLSR